MKLLLLSLQTISISHLPAVWRRQVWWIYINLHICIRQHFSYNGHTAKGMTLSYYHHRAIKRSLDPFHHREDMIMQQTLGLYLAAHINRDAYNDDWYRNACYKWDHHRSPEQHAHLPQNLAGLRPWLLSPESAAWGTVRKINESIFIHSHSCDMYMTWG